MIVFHKPCNEQMASVWKEDFGEVFRCSCGEEVEFNNDKNTVCINGRKESGEEQVLH